MNLNKVFKLFLLFIFVCLLILCGFYYKYLQTQKDQNIKKYFDLNAELMINALENERLNALAISILLSKNSDIRTCYESGDHNYCMNSAKEFASILSQVPNYKNIRIHMHDANTKSLARSFDETKFGDNLSGFRYMLNDVKKNMQPIAGIEVGRCGMFIRGISPVFLDNKFAGSIEVLLDFSRLENIAWSQGLNIFILLNKSFDSDCITNIDKSLLKKYYILNQNIANINLLPNLRRFDFENLNFMKSGQDYFYSKPIVDILNNKVGYVVLHYSDNAASRLGLTEY